MLKRNLSISLFIILHLWTISSGVAEVSAQFTSVKVLFCKIKQLQLSILRFCWITDEYEIVCLDTYIYQKGGKALYSIVILSCMIVTQLQVNVKGLCVIHCPHFSG